MFRGPQPALCKTPDRTDPISIVLVVVVLRAIAEMLFP
jgi:hypothetical protein